MPIPKIDPANYFAWLPARWDSRATAHRRNRGSILADDAFIARLEQKRRKAAKELGEGVPK